MLVSSTEVFPQNLSLSRSTIGLKTLLHEGLSKPEFYGDLVYKFQSSGIACNQFVFSYLESWFLIHEDV